MASGFMALEGSISQYHYMRLPDVPGGCWITTAAANTPTVTAPCCHSDYRTAVIPVPGLLSNQGEKVETCIS